MGVSSFIEGTKVCSKCRVRKPLQDFHRRGKDKVRSRCKVCHNQDNKIHREKNPEYHQNYRTQHAEEIRDYQKKYRKENRKKLSEGAKRRYEKNNWPSLENRSDYQKRYYSENRDYVLSRSSEYKKKNRHISITSNANRKARLKGMKHTLTSAQVELLLKEFNYSCAICGSNKELEIDHWIPVSVGFGGTTYENSIPLCKSHNTSKGASNPNEWTRCFNAKVIDRIYVRLAKLNEVTTEEYRETIDWLFGK